MATSKTSKIILKEETYKVKTLKIWIIRRAWVMLEDAAAELDDSNLRGA